jgi:hypothetical protein
MGKSYLKIDLNKCKGDREEWNWTKRRMEEENEREGRKRMRYAIEEGVAVEK